MKINQYDKIAEKFVQGQREDWQYRRDLRSLLDTPLKNLKILDLGCGAGIDLKYFISENADAYGIDSCKSMLSNSLKSISSEKIVEGDFKKMPYADSFFDIVYSQYSLQHESDLEPIFREIHRVLKPLGSFLLLAPHPIFSYMMKRSKNYFLQEEYENSFFNNTVIIKQLSHKFSDFFHPFILANFHLEKFIENYTAEDFNSAIENWIYPEYVAIKFKKMK